MIPMFLEKKSEKIWHFGVGLVKIKNHPESRISFKVAVSNLKKPLQNFSQEETPEKPLQNQFDR